MKPDHTGELCHLIARLVDAVEALAQHVSASGPELVRLHNIRHDAIMLLSKVEGR